MRQRLHARLSPGKVVAHLIPLLAVGALLVGCQGADRPLAPSLDGAQLSNASASGQGKIVFHSSRSGEFHVFAMNADGTEQTQLSSGDNFDFDPTWSPNGQRIGFNRFPTDFSTSDILLMNADGTGLTNLTNDAPYDFGAIWSPNGKQIAFASNRDGTDDAYVINVDGSGLKRLTTNAYVNAVTAWSPDGKQIAFSSYRDYVIGPVGDLELFVMNADGTNITQLTDNFVDDEGDHAGWSPNGKLFAFSSRRDGGDLDIFVMNADGTGARQLTGIGGDFADDDDSFWSPNGKYLSFHSTRDGDEEVYTMNAADGSGVTQLTFNTGIFDAVPVWASGKVHSDDGQ